jgi:hypothetical protein
MIVNWIFICLLIIGLFVIPNVCGQTQEKTRPMEDSVVFRHVPENGLYWNERKIADYPVPFYLRDNSGLIVNIGCNVIGDNISRLEVLVNNYLLITETSPPYGWGWSPGDYLRMFSHSPTYTTKVYVNDGQVFWDNLTIYRLF